MVDGEAMIDILELIDQGAGTGMGATASKMERHRCVRRDCKRDCADDTGFCEPCLAWVKGETAEDPLSNSPDTSPTPPWAGSYPPADENEWSAYLNERRP